MADAFIVSEVSKVKGPAIVVPFRSIWIESTHIVVLLGVDASTAVSVTSSRPSLPIEVSAVQAPSPHARVTQLIDTADGKVLYPEKHCV
jgi:hypothetical protein